MKVFRSLRWQLAMIILVSIMLPVVVIGYYAVVFELEDRNAAADTQGQLNNAARELEPLFAGIKSEGKEEDLANLLPAVNNVLGRFPGVRASYFNGSVLYTFAVSSKSRLRPETLVMSIPEPDKLSELRRVISSKAGLESRLTDDFILGQPGMEATLPVGADRQGVLILNARVGRFFMAIRLSRGAVVGSLLLGLLIGVTGILLISHRLQRGISVIKAGLEVLTEDLSVPLQPQAGELGLIVEAVNTMRQELVSKRKLEDQLQRAERLAGLGQIVAGVAHEIRNPLGIVKGTVQLMERAAVTEPGLAKYSEHLQIIREQVDRQNRVVEELLSYSRPVKPQLGPVSVPEVIDSVLAFLDPVLRQQGINLEKNLKQALPYILGDGEKLKQVFVNLLLNAREALPQGGNITIAGSATGEMLQVKITDDGNGISPADLEHIFEPFFSTKETGTGLGLSIAKQLVELNGGVLTANSEQGKGTSFEISIPIGGEGIEYRSGD